MKFTDGTISKAASFMGKKGWKARVKKYGLKKLQEHMRQVGKKATGRPRLPDSKVIRRQRSIKGNAGHD